VHGYILLGKGIMQNDSCCRKHQEILHNSQHEWPSVRPRWKVTQRANRILSVLQTKRGLRPVVPLFVSSATLLISVLVRKPCSVDDVWVLRRHKFSDFYRRQTQRDLRSPAEF